MKASNNNYLVMSALEKVEKPFPYAFSQNALNKEIASELLDWLEEFVPWTLVETDFYEQYELSFFDFNLPAKLAFLTSNTFLQQLKRFIEETFLTTLQDKIDLTAHKLISGQRIRIHNDFIPRMESHRLIIQLNRGWVDEYGGMLMLFNSSEPSDLHKILRPVHNSAISFEISEKSNHAVSTINSGNRFTLVYSFYRKYNETSS